MEILKHLSRTEAIVPDKFLIVSNTLELGRPKNTHIKRLRLPTGSASSVFKIVDTAEEKKPSAVTLPWQCKHADLTRYNQEGRNVSRYRHVSKAFFPSFSPVHSLSSAVTPCRCTHRLLVGIDRIKRGALSTLQGVDATAGLCLRGRYPASDVRRDRRPPRSS